MPYQMHRVFCATPGDLENERMTFHEVIGQVNESEAMAKGILLVPVSLLPNMENKLFFQPVVDQNVEDSRFFVLLLDKTWGPPKRNFAREYELACRLKSDAAALMEDVAVFFKEVEAADAEPAVRELQAKLTSIGGGHRFCNREELIEQLKSQLLIWLEVVERLERAPAE